MAMRTVNFEVTPKDGTQTFAIRVGNDNVKLVNGKGSKDLDDNKEHTLIWFFTGDPGGKLAIVGQVGTKTVVEVKESKIPKDRTEGAGFKPFRLKE